VPIGAGHGLCFPPEACSTIVEEVQNEKRQQASPERRCKATTKRGTPCAATVVGPDGLCSAHSGRQDMKALGRLGGRGRRGAKPEQVPASLREELRKLDPSIVRGAIEQALSGSNESARVSAVKLLADIDAFGRNGDKEDWERERAKATAEAAERFTRLIEQRARAHQHGQVRDALDELAAVLSREAVDAHPDLIVGDVGSERAEAILEQLEELGLLVRPSRVEELAEKRAHELLTALRAEHGIPA
jgi:hypothetical protein